MAISALTSKTITYVRGETRRQSIVIPWEVVVTGDSNLITLHLTTNDDKTPTSTDFATTKTRQHIH